MSNQTQRKHHGAYFFTGCLLGILCFVAVYGVQILDVTYDGWLLRGDIDLFQHYTGWGHFRNDPWTFPFGLITSLSKPFPMSVIYTDSIPLFAVLFKLLSPVLPETFQYFGIYGCFSFALQGGVSMILLRRFCSRPWMTVLGAFFFILSFPILQRMFYHTALASQWLLLLALLFWFTRYEHGLAMRCLRWALLGFLCVGIHSYFLPMCGGILLFSGIDGIVAAIKMTEAEENGKRKVLRAAGALIAEATSYCVFALLNLWLLGAFSVKASSIGEGIGSFESNLNTFINPMGYGIFGLKLPVYNDFQYEGFAYLGLGMLLLVLLLAFIGIGFLTVKKIRVKQFATQHYRMLLVVLLFLLFVLLSVCPIVSINSRRIVSLPLPGRLRDLANIFRSNGRFIWVAFYLLMLAAITVPDRVAKPKWKLPVLLLAVALQIVDLAPTVAQKQAYFNSEERKQYTSLWETEKLSAIVADQKEFILIDAPMEVVMDTGYYTMKHHLDTNDFYFARNIEELINTQKETVLKELAEGNANTNAVYVFRAKGFVPAAYPGLLTYQAGDYMIGIFGQ